MKFSISKRLCRKLIYIQLIYVLFINLFISGLGLPSLFTYFTDGVTLLLFFCILFSRSLNFEMIKAKYVSYSIMLFLLVICIGIVMNLVSFQLIFWAFRNTFRGIVFWLACITFLSGVDIKRIFSIFFSVQIVNVLISLFQYYFFGLNQDNLGGIFGIASGCNAYTNVFFIILLTYYCTMYINKSEKFWKFGFIMLSTLLIASLAELKFFYFEFVVIISLCVIFSKLSLKTVLIPIVSLTAVFIGLQVLLWIFPDQYKYIVNYSDIFRYLNSESGGYNISRISAFSRITELFFNRDTFKMLFGFGFGAAEMSSFSLFTSRFYFLYGQLYNYRWFSHMMLYLETGYLGLLSFIAIFGAMFVYATIRKFNKKAAKVIVELSTYTQIMAILTVLNLWYNSAIRNEAQYLTYFALSVCFVMYKELYITSPNMKSDIIKQKRRSFLLTSMMKIQSVEG